MVLSGLIETVIRKFLSPFVDDLTADKLNVFAWSGQVSLNDVSVKPNAFDALKLPFRVVHSNIGTINASVPWSNIYNSPIVIKVSDVFVVVVPNTEITYNEEEEKQYEWALKKSYLENIEQMKQRLNETDTKKEDDGFFMKLVVTAIKNIQIFINNVHICFEDNSSHRGNPFQIGISFSQLLFETASFTNDKHSSDQIINKLVKLEGFSLYLNSKKIQRLSGLSAKKINEILASQISRKRRSELSYILCPINFSTDAIIHRRPEMDSYKIPIVDLNMNLDEFHIQFTNDQIQTLLLLLDSIDRMKSASPYRKWRPNVPIKGHAHLWWKFMYTAIVENGVRRRKRDFSWQNIEDACLKRKQYIELYKRKLLGEQVDDLEQLEKDLKLITIVMARSQAELATKKILESRKATAKKGWFSGWWSSSSSSAEVANEKSNEVIDSIKKEFTPEEKAKLYKAIGYEENTLLQLYPLEFIAHRLKFTVNVFQVSVKNQTGTLMRIEFSTCRFEFLNRPSSSNMVITNQIDSLTVIGEEDIMLLEGKQSKDFLSFKFEANPLDKQFDFGVDLNMKSLYLLYDIGTINQVYSMLVLPDNISLEEIQSYAQYKLGDLKQMTALGLEYAVQKHKQLKLNIAIDPSFVIVPKLADISSASSVLLLSLGKFLLTSKLVPKSSIPKVRDMVAGKEKQGLTGMEKLVYEKYMCHIQNVQMVMSDNEHWKHDLEMLNTDRHVLYPFEIKLDINRSIIPQNPHFPKLHLLGEIPVIEMKASSSQVSQMLGLFITLPYGPTVNEVAASQPDTVDRSSSKNFRISKTNETNNEIADALNYATRTIETFQKEKEKKSNSNTNVDSVDNVGGGDSRAQVVAYKNFIFDFKLHNIYLSMYQENRNAQSALAQLNLVKFAMYGEIFTESIMWVNCSVWDLRIEDIRPARKERGIRTMLEKTSRNMNQNKERHILSTYVSQKSNSERIIVISMSAFTFILALDYMLALIDVATKAFTFPEDSLPVKSTEKTSDLKVKQTPVENAVNIIEFDLNKVQVIMLESLDVPDAEVCIFECHSKINMRLQDSIIIAGQVTQITMFLANYIKYIQSSDVIAKIMKPTDLTINGSIEGDSQKLDFTFDEINITILPQMVSIILTIMAAMGSSSNGDGNQTNHVHSTEDLLKVKPLNRNVWYLNCAPVAREALEMIANKPSENKQLIFNMNSIKILIKSGDESSHPLIEFSLSLLARMIGNTNFLFDCSVQSNYYNHNVMAWEPLIEPINGPFVFQGKMILDGTTKIQIETLENLELLLTKSSVGVLYHLNSAFSSVLSYSKSTGYEENRVIIRNFLGIDMQVLLDKSNITPDSNQPNARNNEWLIKSGKEFYFRKQDMSMVEIFVRLIFSDTVIVERKIMCQKSSVRSYFTSIKTYPVNENWKFIVQVHDSGASSKEIVFRSNTQIVNKFDCSFELYSFSKSQNNQGETIFIGKVDPLSTYFVPLQLVYGEDMLFIRPSQDYEMSNGPVDWRNIDQSGEDVEPDSCLAMCNQQGNQKISQKYIIISCLHKENTSRRFNVKVRAERFNVLYEDTERIDNDNSYLHTIKFIPFVRLKNMLPYSIELSYEPVESDIIELGPGEEASLPFVIFGKSMIRYRVLNYLNRIWETKAILPASGRESETAYYYFSAPNSKHGIYLAVNYSVEKSSLVLSLFSSYWMVNKTNENLTYRMDDNHIFSHHREQTTPFLLCFDPKQVSKKDKLSVAICDSLYSNFFPLDVAPYNESLLPKDKRGRFSYCINVRVELSRIGMTKIVTVASFYSIINISKYKIDYSENNEDWFSIDPECSNSFFPTRSSNQTICFRFSGTDDASKFVSLRESSQTLLTLQKICIFVEIDVTEMEAKVKISDYFDGAAPVLVVNDLNRNIYYGQKNVTKWEQSKQRHVKMLPAKHTVYFCWIEPLEKREFVFKTDLEEEEEKVINLEFDKYVIVNDEFGWVTFFDSKQRVLIFTPDRNLPQTLLKTEEITKPNLTLELIMKGIGVNMVDNERKKDLCYMSINSTCIWEERSDESKHFKALSIKENNILERLYQAHYLAANNRSASVIKSNSHQGYEVDFENKMLLKPRRAHLRRTSNRGLWFLYSSSEHIKQYHIKVNRIQIDNQLPDHIFNVVFSPVIVPKSISDNYEIEQKSFVEISAIVQSLGSITRYKYIQVLVQEFMLQIDLGWVSQIMNLFEIDGTKDEPIKVLIAKDLEYINKNTTLTEMQKFVMRKNYYDFLLFGPLKIHLSVAIGDLPDGKFPFGLDFIIRFTSVTILETNDTLVKLDYFERRMVFMGDSELVNQVVDHYKTQVLMQLYKFILGLDIIGNPMKLALGIKKGIGDFFYEPAIGIIHGPEEFAEGVASGFKSLASNVLGGTAGALGRIGNQLGTGFAALTIDDKFQKERRERMNRKTGFAESGKNLLRGFVSGLTGVVTKPIEGAKEEGVEGLFKGVGRGVVGIVAQPATGFIDFASGSLHAFNNVIDPKQVAKPVRPPRHFKAGQEMTPYVLQDATGDQLLKNLSEGKYATEEYKYHIQTSPNHIVLLTNQNLFYLKKSTFSNSWDNIEWIESWDNCQKVILEKDRIRILIKDSKKTLIIFAGAKEHTIVVEDNERLRILYSHVMNLLNDSNR